MALVLALLLGMVMMAGVSGLLARQLMSRRLSAKESYLQMAEAAANNGLNRILGELNNAEPDQNRGFLFTLDNRENINEPNNGFSWERLNTDKPPAFSELCLDTSIDLPLHPEAKANAIWPTTEVPLNEENSPSMREDGISKIETFYRLGDTAAQGHQEAPTAERRNSSLRALFAAKVQTPSHIWHAAGWNVPCTSRAGLISTVQRIGPLWLQAIMNWDQFNSIIPA